MGPLPVAVAVSQLDVSSWPDWRPPTVPDYVHWRGCVLKKWTLIWRRVVVSEGEDGPGKPTDMDHRRGAHFPAGAVLLDGFGLWRGGGHDAGVGSVFEETRPCSGLGTCGCWTPLFCNLRHPFLIPGNVFIPNIWNPLKKVTSRYYRIPGPAPVKSRQFAG